jgi:hypothetical protein
VNSIEQQVRDAMQSHDLTAPRADRLVRPTRALARANRPARAGRSGRLTVAALACAALLVAGVIGLVSLSRGSSSIAPATAQSLTCPATASHGVPATPSGVNGKARLVPVETPTRVVVCAYIAPRSPEFKGSPVATSGAVTLTGNLAGVATDLTWVPPSIPGQQESCTSNLAATDGDEYLIGLNYSGATVWVAAHGNHCSGATNGRFNTNENIAGWAASWYRAGHWVSAQPQLSSPQATGLTVCEQGLSGRLGQQKALVPPGAITVQACEGKAATPVEPIAGHQDLLTALAKLKTTPVANSTCNPGSKPFGYYVLRFGYAQGPPVDINIITNGGPACFLNNGSLEAGRVETVLPALQRLLETAHR